MKIGVIKRIGSFLIDALPVIGVLSLLFTFFVGDYIKPENYDEHLASYQQKVEDYNQEVYPYYEELVAGDITQAEYDAIASPIEDSYFGSDETETEITAYITYVVSTVVYYLAGFNVIYLAYNIITKSKTIGRKIMRIELKGKVNWWTILLRELIWKTGFWVLTLGVGIIVDIFMIGITTKKRTFRDMVSNTHITQEGVDYSF